MRRWRLAASLSRSTLHWAIRPGEPPGVRRGVRLEHGADLQGRALLRPAAGHLACADTADGGTIVAAKEEGAAGVAVALLAAGCMRKRFPDGVWPTANTGTTRATMYGNAYTWPTGQVYSYAHDRGRAALRTGTLERLWYNSVFQQLLLLCSQ